MAISLEESKSKIKEITGQKYAIKLLNEAVILERKQIPIQYLRLDPKNQRIQFLMASKGYSLTDNQIENALWQLDYVKQLANSIRTNGGLLSPLIVKADGIVVEGNSRLVALRYLKTTYFDKEGITPFEDVLYPQCEVLPEDFDERRLLWLLGEWHIAGKHEWNAYEQAEYIYKMWKEGGQTYDVLVNHLRMSKSTIKQKISAYEMMSEYLKINHKPEEIDKWSYFEEFFKKKELREKLDKEPKFQGEFFDLVASAKNGKFRGEHVRRLPDIVEDEKAWDVLKSEKDFQKAISVIQEKKIKSLLADSLLSCASSLDTVEVKEIFELQQTLKESQNHPTADAVRTLHKKILSFSNLVGVDLNYC